MGSARILLRGQTSLSWCKEPLWDGRGACQEVPGVTSSFLGFSRCSFLPPFVCTESYIAAPATGNSCCTAFLSDSGLSFFLFETCCLPIKFEPWGASYGFGEQEVSLPGEQREDPQGHTPCLASEYLHLSSEGLGHQPKWLWTMQVGVGKDCNTARPPGPRNLGSIFSTTHPSTLLRSYHLAE